METSAIGPSDPIESLEGSPLGSGEQSLLSGAGLETLYREHGPRLLRLLVRRVGRDDAGDLVQEAFAKLAAMLPTARASIDRPEAFVTTVATNVLRDRARTAARQALQLESFADHNSGSTRDPHQLTESREALQAIERSLSLMNSRRRQIFMLHRFERLTYAEIGIAVGMSEKGVKKQIAKALLELRAAVERRA